jgi:high-affinity Fe2+/Pb2+ permease
MNDQMLKANEKARSLAVAVGAVGVLVVAVLTGWVVPWGLARLEREEPRTVLWVLEAVTAAVFLSVVPMALYLYRWCGTGRCRRRARGSL